ncbi:putative amp dependent CoA ligase [Bisporella sp. PMI_857]|nr:putative amp dependent CoA ligase [Bisporella sp. PMI_857]
MLFIILSIVALFLTPFGSFLLSLIFSKKGNVEQQAINSQVAEIDGGEWERLSVFEHVEQGLKRNPNGPAVICSFQPTDHLDELLSRTKKAHPPSALWQQRSKNGPAEQVNGFLGEQTNGHQKVVLWSYQERALTNGIRKENVVENSCCLTLSYTELHHVALKLAAGLSANGARPNTMMLMLIPNGSEFTILLYTCILLRITYVCMDPSILDISGFTMLKHHIQTLKPQIVITPDTLSGKAIDVALAELQLPIPIRVSLSPSRTLGWKSLTDIATDSTRAEIDQDVLVAEARSDNPNRIHSIMFTSGTSGLPKGCPMRVRGQSHVLNSQKWLIDEETGAFALQQPHNSRGIAPVQTLQTWKAGGAVVMTGQEFSVTAAAEAIRQFGVTFVVLTPPMVHEFAAELATRPIDVSSVKKIQIGGDAVTKGILSKCAALFPRAQVCVNHGMTEGGGSFVWPFFNTPTSRIPFFGELCPIGTVASGSIIRIWDSERNCVVGRGELGELHISCESIIHSYLGGRSSEVFYNDTKGRWFKTGDNAVVDKDGLIFILGRTKDMIKRAGVKIMPSPIESSIGVFAGAQTIVVPAPHYVLGTEPFAVLSSYNGKTEREIKDHVRSVFGNDYALGGLATLKQLGFVEFPLNSTHKIIKSQVQEAVLKHLKRTRYEKAATQ